MGANVERSGSNVTVKGGALKGAVVDVSDTPDLVPALAVAMAAAQGESRIIGGERLRIKESDRIATVCENLAKLGCDITETQDGMIINGGRLTGCAVSSFNDHRIAMAMAVAAAICDGEIELDDADCVKKSAPQFWDEFKKLGGKTK
jgi:3-phosphoshikimate 1-carboxyvinyltransferase